MGIIPWIGYEPVYLARDLGWLPPGVTLVEGENAGDSLDRLIRGEIDAAALTLDELLVARAAGVPVETALVFNVSMGADKLLAKPEIESVEHLAGKVIAVESDAVGMLVLRWFFTHLVGKKQIYRGGHMWGPKPPGFVVGPSVEALVEGAQ